MLSKINAWIAERIAKSAANGPLHVAVEPSGLRVQTDRGQRVFLWATMTRIVAYTRPSGIGDTMCLALEIEGGEIFEMGEDLEDWDRVCDQLSEHIPLEVNRNEWKTRLLAEPSKPVAIYERPADMSLEKGA